MRAAGFAGLEPSAGQMQQMEAFANWLRSEGRRGGGIGPGEPERIDRRHLADSVLFASQFPSAGETVWDLGTGVGLPGVPLAILLPRFRFQLIDRSGRRIDMLRRAVRMLNLDNCQVVHSDIKDLIGRADVIVSRASLSLDDLTAVAKRHLNDEGLAIVAGSWREKPDHRDWTTIEIPEHVLDQAVWLLIMRRQ